MDVYILITTFVDGWEDDHTDVVGVYTELKDAMNAGEEIRKNNLEPFYSAYIYHRRLDETPNDYRINLVMWAWNAGIWEERRKLVMSDSIDRRV